MELLIKGFDVSNELNEEWIKENCYIAGGACVSNATRSKINDIDVYFKTKEARDFFMKNFEYEDKYITKDSDIFKALVSYEEKLESKEIEIGKKINFGEIGINSRLSKINEKEFISYLITIKCLYYDFEIPEPLLKKQKWMLENGYDYVLLERNHYDVNGEYFLGNKSITIIRKINNEALTYQFILRFYGDPEKMMDETFDFQHCKIAYDLKTKEYICSKETWECLSKRVIKYVNSFYPISSLKRLYKYANRGYLYTNDEFVKIIKDIHKIDVENKYIIEDQMIGYYEDFDYNCVFKEDEFNWLEE